MGPVRHSPVWLGNYCRSVFAVGLSGQGQRCGGAAALWFAEAEAGAQALMRPGRQDHPQSLAAGVTAQGRGGASEGTEAMPGVPGGHHTELRAHATQPGH